MVFELQLVEEFYADKTVLITGATGFLGCMTLEKLLRACPRIKKIYLLIRSKRDKDCTKRLNQLFDSVVFENLIKEQPEFKTKMSLISGDCCLPDLALRPEGRQIIISEVEVIIHWAATVKFDENLKVATNINVRAVRDLLRMAKDMPQLKAFLHVSTAFSNCIRTDIDEIFYDTPINGQGLIEMMDAMDAQLVSEITPSLLRKWPNSYVFTKAVAENLIRDEGRGLPIGIIRPSIVLGSYKEPVPGWINNIYGATGVLMGCAIGILRIMQVNLSCKAEMVPADYVVNNAIAATVDIHYNHEKMMKMENPKNLRIEEAIPIYNIVSSTCKSIDWETFMKLSQKYCMQVPSPKIIWHSFTIFTSYYYVYLIGAFFLHTLPAHVIDFVTMALGKPTRAVKIYKKIHKFSDVLAFFSTREWKFHNDNVQRLYCRLKLSDRELFDFNIAAFCWDDYFSYYIRGGRKYILQDTEDTIPQGKKKMRCLQVAHYCLCGLILYLIYLAINFLMKFLNVW